MFRADVLALKHANGLYGADLAVVAALAAGGISVTNLLPPAGDFRLIQSQGAIPFDSVIFIGTGPLYELDYAGIRAFSRRALALLAVHAPQTRHLVLTLHGPGFGLNEAEAFRSEIAGLTDSVSSGEHPESLERITIVERSRARAARLTELLSSLSVQRWRMI
ncbi:MAG TPA: hypothetical protein VFR37_12345 [Longimicrobium sp.]|nr:hypothetical protein [Longimicrobium sp.]